MAPSLCEVCNVNRALILRPKNHQKICRTCFIDVFELEVHNTITSHNLFTRGESVAIGASGGKDSTVLASVMKTLNERYDYGLNLILLSIDEGITGYRDDSLETVKRNAVQYGMPLSIIGYKELYGWTMDEVVSQVGKKGNCTYCGVFRRQALDRGAEKLKVNHVVTGHNADDIAETVLMNCMYSSSVQAIHCALSAYTPVVLRGDLPRLARATSILTSSSSSPIKRSKPLKYAYEKEIVLYAHHKKLDYFSTECIYSPEAFRGSARALIKNLERIRPSAILDVVRSGEDMAKCVPVEIRGKKVEEEEGEGGCGSANGRSSGGEMADMERDLRQGEEKVRSDGMEVEIASGKAQAQRHERHTAVEDTTLENAPVIKKSVVKKKGPAVMPKKVNAQKMGQCERCGYLTSQPVCKACTLLEGLNRNRPRTEVTMVEEENLVNRMEGVSIAASGG